jgi:hypothetical protein
MGEATNWKVLIWGIGRMAFAGSFRICELLCRDEGQFHPDHTLLTEDMTEKRDSRGHTVLYVKLKCPKNSWLTAPIVIDVFKMNGQM